MPKRVQPSSTVRQLYPFITELAGSKGLKIARQIGEGATDEHIEKKTKIKMSEIRATLNILHNCGIVEYTREKNMKTGWFTYTWKINPERAMRNFLAIKQKEYTGLHKQMSSEDGAMFYKCKKGCARLAFDVAMENKFKCPKCSSKLHFANNAEEIKGLEKKIKTLQQIVGMPEAPQ